MSVLRSAPLPNPAPRPSEELDGLRAAWQRPRGWRVVLGVNNSQVGLFYIATSLAFFVLAGVLGLLMRAQLALPEQRLLSPETYNQVFTMHGTLMMFLFAVPVVEAIAVYLLPAMLGARDLPFPRLSAYAFWAYAVGGTVFFGTLFFGVAPDGGWFMYPPLTNKEHSPGLGANWLLGIGFIEISAIAGAIELIIGILFTRAPGMTLRRMPVFAWAMLVVALMIVFAFPAMIAGTTLLEAERAFDLPLFSAGRGGDPLLWQHLFWFFGHPEVYIIFLPAAGLVSMMIPALTGTPLVGRMAVVASLGAVGLISFALWAHHMFTAGRSAAGPMFGGFNLAFFPMHVSGLLGMPRRVYTYDAGLGWTPWNLASTVGAFVFAAGVLWFFIAAWRAWRQPEAAGWVASALFIALARRSAAAPGLPPRRARPTAWLLAALGAGAVACAASWLGHAQAGLSPRAEGLERQRRGADGLAGLPCRGAGGDGRLPRGALVDRPRLAPGRDGA